LIITDFLEGKRYSENEIDALMMSVTKRVETTLKDSIERYQGKSLPSKISGDKLLDHALGCHFIKNKEEPIYSLLYWTLKEPRNTSHHEFTTYPYNTLVQFMLEANMVIQRIRTLAEPGYSGRFDLSFDPNKKTLGIEYAKVWRPDDTDLPLNQKVEITFKFPDEAIKTLPLSPSNNGYWKGGYDARGESAGTVWANLRGVNHGRPFNIATGSTVALFPVVGENCPNCGKTIDYQTSICPKCGSRLRI